MNRKITKNQALLTAIGFMIGSGIFFRADNILSSTQGNVLIAILAWIFISSTLIFAGISVAVIAADTQVEGGFVGYIEYHFTRLFGEKIGKRLAFIIGWYQIVVYVPILVAVVSTVFADYFFQLFGLNMTLINQYIVTFLILVAMFIWNGLSTKIAALVSSTATVVKVIPLIVLAVLGITMGDPENFTTTAIALENTQQQTAIALFFAPMLSMAFAFDGWISVGSLSVDMEKPKKDLPKIFTYSVIITSIVYILYFVGVSLLMPAEQIIAEGNNHVGIIASQRLGAIGEKFVLTAVVISVLGTANAIFMAGARYTHKLACNNQLFNSSFFKQESKHKTPFNSSIFTFIVTAVYVLLFFLQAGYEGEIEFIKNVVIDDIPMALNSIFYLFVFYITFRLFKEKKTTTFKGLIAPIIAAIGQIFIVLAFFSINGLYSWGYLVISFVIISLGYIMYKVKTKVN